MPSDKRTLSRREWNRIASEAQAAMREIDAAERDKKNAYLVGKCLRYRNSYGSGPDERWWLFCKVLRVDDGDLILHRFQTTSLGEIKIEPAYRENFRLMMDGWQSISEDDFGLAWREVQQRIARLPEACNVVE